MNFFQKKTPPSICFKTRSRDFQTVDQAFLTLRWAFLSYNRVFVL